MGLLPILTSDKHRPSSLQPHTNLHDSSHLHQRDELSPNTVGQPSRQLRQKCFKWPKLLQLLITQRTRRNNRLPKFNTPERSPSRILSAPHTTALAVYLRSQWCWYLCEVEHAGAEGRGGAEQGLDETSAQLELVGHAPQVCLLQ